MKRSLSRVATAAAVVAFAFSFVSCGGKKTGEQSTELELLTILGDVANRPDDLAGRWRPARPGENVPSPGNDASSKVDELTALPYLQGSTEAPDVVNITAYVPDRAYNGYNLYTSGHEPAAYLMNMKGEVVHKWQYEVEDVWPDVPRTIHSTFWRRAWAYPNGDVLAIFEGIGLLKLDKDSNLLWAYRGGCHHEVFVANDGRLYLLTRRAQMLPRINAARPVLPDYVTVLSADGREIASYPLLDIFEKSPYSSFLDEMRPEGDLFHTNSIYVFDGTTADKFPYYKKGNILLSMLKLDALVILDPESGELVWAAKSGWKRQHDPTVLPDGNIMLFDNRGRAGQKSRVVKIDPATKKIVWQYHGPSQDLNSKTCGVSRLLPNGDILITESDNGRALEITANKDLVWEFYNPHRAGDKDELIATLFEVTRLGPDYFPWMSN